MIRQSRAIACVLFVALAGCANDYDLFDFPEGTGGAGGRDAIAADHETVTDGEAIDGGDFAEGEAGAEPAEAGESAVDASNEAMAEGVDGAADVAERDSPGADADSSEDFQRDATDEATRDASDEAMADATDDVIESDAPIDAGPPDVSIAAEGSVDDGSSESPANVPDASVDVIADADDGLGDGAKDGATFDCDGGQKRCAGSCVRLDDPQTGCGGASCSPCLFAHATAQCALDGACAIDSCAAGFDDCDHRPETGCESYLEGDVENCGTCGRRCSTLGALSRQCSGGTCGTSCGLGYANCARPVSGTDDGCETVVARDDDNCGGCGNRCSQLGTNGGFVCAVGVVSDNQCGCASDAVCGGTSGSCNAAIGRCSCGGALCRPGEACVSGASGDACSCRNGAGCGALQTCCQSPAGCRSLDTDPANCGACGHACPVGFFCTGGACACTADAQCDAGSPGVCTGGQCACSSRPCSGGQRCQADGHCG